MKVRPTCGRHPRLKGNRGLMTNGPGCSAISLQLQILWVEGFKSPLSATLCLSLWLCERRQRGRVPGRPVPRLRAGRRVSSGPRVGGQRSVGVHAVLPPAGRRPSAQRASAPPPHTDVHAEGRFIQVDACRKRCPLNTNDFSLNIFCFVWKL